MNEFLLSELLAPPSSELTALSNLFLQKKQIFLIYDVIFSENILNGKIKVHQQNPFVCFDTPAESQLLFLVLIQIIPHSARADLQSACYVFIIFNKIFPVLLTHRLQIGASGKFYLILFGCLFFY